jgi:hypothetical protein
MSDYEAEMSEAVGNWLECLPWNGQEASLPAGGNVQIPGLSFRKLVYRVQLLDAESEEGYRWVKQAEITPEDLIIGTKLNENSIKAIEQNYGPDWIRIADPNGGKQMSRQAWRDKFGTDGLNLLAIRDLRYGKPVTSVGQKPTQGKPQSKPQYMKI